MLRALGICCAAAGFSLANAGLHPPAELPPPAAQPLLAAQLAAQIEGGFAPKKYANVLSEFEGEVDVDASPETCYALWNDPSFLTRFVPGLETASFVGGADAFAECDLYYQFGDARTHALERLRFMTAAVERVPNERVHWQSTDGFPCGVVAGFWPHEDDASLTHVRVEAYCHLPFDLAKEHGAMSLGLDIERSSRTRSRRSRSWRMPRSRGWRRESSTARMGSRRMSTRLRLGRSRRDSV